MGPRILVIGDVHFPFVNHKSLNQIYDFIKYVSPTIVLQIGDLYDLYSFSKFPRSHDIMSPKDELTQAYGDAYVMWEKIRKLAPRAKYFQMLGNHDDRLAKRVMERLPEAESFLDLKQMWSFPKVEVSKSERDELYLHKILFMHGFRSKLGDHARHNGMSTVCGHSHLGGAVYIRLGNKTIFELNAGYIADEASKALSYTRQAKVSRWTQGFGYIDHLGPRFIPLENV
jgi:predicted phosphodiesterase